MAIYGDLQVTVAVEGLAGDVAVFAVVVAAAAAAAGGLIDLILYTLNLTEEI